MLQCLITRKKLKIFIDRSEILIIFENENEEYLKKHLTRKEITICPAKLE